MSKARSAEKAVSGCHDEHYVRSVVQMGDSRNIYTNQAIFTTNKIKLVEKGVKVNSTLYERLVSHKLIPKIDECLSVDNAITQKKLQEYAHDLLNSDPGMFVINKERRTREKILRAIEGIVLLPPLAFKLTVACEQYPTVYEHSVRVALIALFLAIKSYFFSQKELATFATAAIFHDLGILHIPPKLLKPGRRLGKADRHYLYTHPITGYLLLEAFTEYHPEISRTVFEHHERLDGSGYPRGLHADEICLGAQILMLAEVANTVFEKSAKSQSLAKLSVLLRINQRKFNEDLSNRLIAILQSMETDEHRVDEEASAFTEVASFERKLSDVEQVFQNWYEAMPSLQNVEISQSSVFLVIGERIQSLKHSLYRAGIDIQDTTFITEIGREDQESLRELSILVGETHWQLSEIIHEAHRRLNEVEISEECHHPVIKWLETSEKILQLH